MPHRSPFGFLSGEPKKERSQVVLNNQAKKWTDESASDNQPDSNDELEVTSTSTPAEDRSENTDNGGLKLLNQNSPEHGLWRQAWDDVRDELQSMLPPELQSTDTLDTLEQVQGVHDEAQKRADYAQEHERTIAGTKGKKTYREIYAKIARCANEFQIVGNMISQAEPVYAALPWALIQFGLKCAVGEDEAYQTMLSGVELVSDLVRQYRALENLYAKIQSEPSKKLRKSLVSFYKTILRFQVFAIRYFDQGRKGRRALIGLNPVTQGDIQNRRQDIDTLKHQVDADAAIVSYEVEKVGLENLTTSQEGQDQQLEAIKEGILALAGNTGRAIRNLNQEQEERNKVLITMWKEPLDELRIEVENREIDRARANLRHIRNWLSVTRPRDDLEEASDKRRMPLGDWLLEHPKFQRWQSKGHSSMLWLYGFTGTGKTGLTCRVIRLLETSVKRSGRMACFFCSNDKAHQESFSRADPEEALRSIVSQLATSKESNYVAPILQSKYDAFGPDSDQSMDLTYPDCVDILVKVSEHMPITIVIDAFDECDQDKSPKLLQHLQEVIQRSPLNVKIFISTRSFLAIEDALTPDRSIEVTAANNGNDVRTFIRSTLDFQIKEKNLLNGEVPDDLKEEIESTLTNRAGNMFMYASLLLEQLCDKNFDDVASVRKKLESLPRDLTDVYDRIMAEIHDSDGNSERNRVIAQSTFKWLLCAQGRDRIPADALLEAISPHEKRASHEDVLRACRTLVIKEKGGYQFAHYSVREHISQIAEYRLSQCHLIATQSCLKVLDRSFKTKRSRDELSDAQKAFEQYALVYWPIHYEGINREEEHHQRAAINAMLRSLLLQGHNQRNKYNEWFEEVRKKTQELKENKSLATKLNALQSSPLSPLFAACVFGFEDLIAKFGRELDGLNKANESGQTALCLAIENGKLDVVKSLLTRRFPADPNLLNTKAVEQFMRWGNVPANEDDVIIYASAMQCAAATGQLAIAEYLIEQGAHIDLVAGYYGSPLQAAALKGHASVVELLLRSGAEPNSQGGFHGNALQAAAAVGNSTIIDLLLENKPPALVGTPGGYYGSAIRAATHSGNSDAVWALLEEKADPNTSVSGGDSLLVETVNMGPAYRDIVTDLINAGSKPDISPNGNEVHLMHRAAMFGMTELVEYCLKNGCPVDMVTTRGPNYPRRYGDFPSEMTPLGYACAEGHADIVELLLDNHAPFEVGKPNSAPLWTAAYQGHANVVDLLLRRFKQTHTAEETEQFMHQRPGPRSGHPILFAAASSGKADVVKTLIEHGARYESNWFKATPLVATATFDGPNVTELLLEYHSRGTLDICINQQSKDGRTAIYEACHTSHATVAMMLLEAGADYRLTHSENILPLHRACSNGLFRVVLSMVERAAKELDREIFLNFLNTRHRPTGRTPLMDCATMDHLASLNVLLEHGAEYTISTNDNDTILHHSSRPESPAIMAAILERAARDLDKQQLNEFINQRHSNGKTALIECAERNRLESANLLLSHGADYTIGGRVGNTPLHWACMKGHTEIVKTILRQAKSDEPGKMPLSDYINRPNMNLKTPLIHAAAGNHLQAVNVLLAYDTDLTLFRSENGSVTALHAACAQGSKEVAQRLLDVAFQKLLKEDFIQFMEARNGFGGTPLREAVSAGSLPIVKLLLSMNADYASADMNEVTSLHTACFLGHLEVAAALLDVASREPNHGWFKPFLNHRNYLGRTALFDASETGRPEIVRLLLDYGADHTICNEHRETVLHAAAWNGRPKVAFKVLEVASRDEDKGRFTGFINARNEQGKTALMDACQTGRPEIARALLNNGADYSLGDNENWTALHYCAVRNRINCVRVLLEHASKDPQQERFHKFLNQIGKKNRATALQDVAWAGNPDVARLLLEYKPNYEHYDDSKRTPLHGAIQSGRVEIAKMLIQYAGKDADKDKFWRFVNAVDDKGDTAWKVAKRKNMRAVMDALRVVGVVDR